MMKKLLLADDSITIQKVVGIIFSAEEYQLDMTDDGNSAFAKALIDLPDLVIADISMPGKDGFELCRAIKNEPKLVNTSVLLLPGMFDKFDEDKATEVCADGWLTKPFESQALLDKVAELLAAKPIGMAGIAPPSSAPEAEIESSVTEEPAAPIAVDDFASIDDTVLGLDVMDDAATDVIDPVDESPDDIWDAVSFAEEDLQEQSVEPVVEPELVLEDDIESVIEPVLDDRVKPDAEVVSAFTAEDADAVDFSAFTEDEEELPALAQETNEETAYFIEDSEDEESLVLTADLDNDIAPEPEPEIEPEPIELTADDLVDEDIPVAMDSSDDVIMELQEEDELVDHEPLGNVSFAAEEQPDSLTDFGEEEEILDLSVGDIVITEAPAAVISDSEEVAAPFVAPEPEIEPEAEIAELLVEDTESVELVEGSAASEDDEEFFFDEVAAADDADPAVVAAVVSAEQIESIEQQLGELSEEELNAVVAKVAGPIIEKLAAKMVEKIAWEVVPDLAEAIIQEEIRKIKEGA